MKYLIHLFIHFRRVGDAIQPSHHLSSPSLPAPNPSQWTAAYQAPPPMGFSRQEYWSGVPLPSPTLYLPLRGLEGVPGLPGAPQDEAGLTRKFDRRRQWHPTPVLLPGKSHGWRSLVGCSPWGRPLGACRALTGGRVGPVSDSVRPHRWQPTRLLHPWDFPGKSTGVGCH